MSRLHRFFVAPDIAELSHDFWLHDERLVHQWHKVLRYQSGQQVLLFDGIRTERLYTILELSHREAKLSLVTDYVRQLPSKNMYLLWSLLKKDKNDWVLQKATELGVTHFVPLLAQRSEKTGFATERAIKICIEAAEQCGRSDIPSVREPMLVATALQQVGANVPLLVSEQGGNRPKQLQSDTFGVLIGPEGGWTDVERTLFTEHALPELGLGQFTLRAETAAVSAVAISLS